VVSQEKGYQNYREDQDESVKSTKEFSDSLYVYRRYITPDNLVEQSEAHLKIRKVVPKKGGE
jgi:hypothetical protein